MKVSLPNESKQSIGGGWSFRSNIAKGLQRKGFDITEDNSIADIVLLCSSTMVTRKLVEEIKRMNKKIVLRVDNIPRNSRNRNTGTSRLYDMAQMADAVVYQSKWARDYVMPFIGKYGEIIYNGIDTDIFTKDGPIHPQLAELPNVYLYSRYNRDETKNWEVAWYEYQLIQKEEKDAHLAIVGNFSPEQIEYNFDFYRNERFTFFGVTESPETMASIYRGCDKFLAVYYNDCYSNTYQEAMACGVELVHVNMSGGTPELIENGPRSIDQMTDDYIRLFRGL